MYYNKIAETKKTALNLQILKNYNLLRGDLKMPNLTTPIPNKITGDASEDLKAIQKWGTALIDELAYIFNNLDAGNVSEAASVKAENIDTNTAKIQNAQIGILTADKLKAGTVDTNLVTVSSESGNLNISGNSIVISDNNVDRFKAEYNPLTGIFSFILCNSEGQPTVYINSLGNAVFSGKIDSSEIYSSTIVGTDSVSYDKKTGGVFAEIDTTGIKVMQDKNNSRQQKIGMSVGDDGTAYMVLGAGDGSGQEIINGVVYSNGSFLIQKNSSFASLGIAGGQAVVSFMNNGELWLRGGRVLINGRDVLSEIDSLKAKLEGNV